MLNGKVLWQKNRAGCKEDWEFWDKDHNFKWGVEGIID